MATRRRFRRRARCFIRSVPPRFIEVFLVHAEVHLVKFAPDAGQKIEVFGRKFARRLQRDLAERQRGQRDDFVCRQLDPAGCVRGSGPNRVAVDLQRHAPDFCRHVERTHNVSTPRERTFQRFFLQRGPQHQTLRTQTPFRRAPGLHRSFALLVRHVVGST